MPRPKPTRPAAPQPKSQAPSPPETIDPIWILKAFGVTILAALVCGYATLCLLFYQGQWQLILHPQRTAAPLKTLAGLPADSVHFDASETGLPRLSGAYLAAEPASAYPGYTVLYLRPGDASLAQSASDSGNIGVLHNLGLGVFAFDYRGYGDSDPTRPNQVRMSEDADSALQWLLTTRRIPIDHIVLFGTGVGASLAVRLAAANPTIQAVILDSPGADPLITALTDPRTRALPVRSLFHEDFSLAALSGLQTPKLLISYPTPASPVPQAYLGASTPKTTLELVPDNPAPLAQGITRFLDQNLVRTTGAMTTPQKSQ